MTLLAEVRAYPRFTRSDSSLTPVADFDDIEDSPLGLHEPDPADFFHPHLRREFLLEDGSRTVLSSRDQTTSYNDTIFYSLRDGEVVETRAVKELLGEEKSPELQHPSLRRKRALQFAS